MSSSNIKSLVLDMDGVIWKADTPIGNLPRLFEDIRSAGLKFIFVTNNGTRTPEQYVERLQHFGVKVDSSQVITSSLGVAYLLSQRFPNGGPVFAIGEEGIFTALKEQGFTPLTVEDPKDALAVIIGIDHQVTFEKMSEACLLVRKGIPFYATNPDKTFPTPRGEIPGAGAWISVIVTATNIEPIYAGKPYPYLINLARGRLKTSPEETLVVGDRIETDIAGGQAAGCPVALMLSGVSTREAGESWKPAINYIRNDLTYLVRELAAR